ncbi:MAG: CotH kinase family protein [Saprospiraceae bacterium]
MYPRFLRSILLLIFYILVGQLSAQLLRSNLPIVVINTGNQYIPDDQKIDVEMKIIDPATYYQTEKDEANVYTGKVGIELRGSSSQSFPKKAYSFETRDAQGEDKDVSIFGWPEESDYILYPSYHEKSLMHNVLAMELFRSMGFYASRTQFVEVLIDQNYMGVYVVMEKIKRSKGRVDIAKLEPEEIAGDEVTGGYIVKIDKQTGSQSGGWLSNYPSLSTFPKNIFFQYHYPEDGAFQQRAYIKDYVSSFESSLKSPFYKDADKGYRKWINVESFIYYWILNEVSRNVDGYRLSTFLYKDKDSKGGKLTIGPPWDFDIAFGNADYCNGQSYQGFSWQFNTICPEDGYQLPFWWDKLLQDSFFLDSLSKVYDYQRKEGSLRKEFIFSLIDSMSYELQEAQVRNFKKWNILGQYVWPNPSPIPSSWQGEVQELKNWIGERLIWLDNNLPRNKTPITEVVKTQFRLKFNQNDGRYTIGIQQPFPNNLNCRLIDINGRIMSQSQIWIENTAKEIPLSDIFPSLQSPMGIFFLELTIADHRETLKIIQI